MEGNGTRMDYEDMFREITKKLYGEDPDHKTSSVQNEFEASYKNDEDTGNGTDGSDDGHWTYEDEPFKGTDGSRIAAYHAGKAMWRCDECGEIITSGPREIAEHFMDYHPSRILTDSSRNRHHSSRKDYLQTDIKIEDMVMYLERLRERAERAAPPSRRTQETQTVPAALLPLASSFLVTQELPPAPAPQHLQQNTTTMSSPVAASTSGKRYTCPYCPYGTDRRDLYTRHENIHREEKPFHCYMCYKPFNRADHVKKHFMRMHRDHAYDVSRIRRPTGTTAPKPLQDSTATSATVNVSNQQQPQQQHMSNQFGFPSNKSYQLQPNAVTGAGTGTGTTGIHQPIIMPSPTGIVQSDANCNTGRRMQNGGCNSKSHLKGGSKSTQERSPVGGGRPPPGPPVFPAPAAPTIAPATTVIPPSTILGCPLPVMLKATNRLSDSPSSSGESESRLDGKENKGKIRRSRKQSQPRQVIWHEDHRKRYLIPDLNTKKVRNIKIDSKSIAQQRSTSQRMFKCHLCPKYAPARGKTHRPYHSRASLTLHMLWRHKRGSWSTKNQTIRDNLASTVSSVTLKATFFNNPNFRYNR